MVSIDRSLSKGLAPRLLAVFHRPLSSERLFKFQHHLLRAFGIVETIAKAVQIFVALYEREEKKKKRALRTDRDRVMDMDTGHGHGRRRGHGHGHRRGRRRGHGHGHKIGALLPGVHTAL
jgi:hypothetical protein